MLYLQLTVQNFLLNSTKVDVTTAEDEANYLLKKNGNSPLATSAYTAEVQEDGKSVVITLVTPIANTDTAVFTVGVENVQLKG